MGLNVIGGCPCDCGEDVPTCSLIVRASDCYWDICPPGGIPYTPITINYEIFYPSTDTTPLCSGTMTNLGPPETAIYESDPCSLTSWPGCGQVRIRLTTTDPRRESSIERFVYFCCYYPAGSYTCNMYLPQPLPGYVCECGGDGLILRMDLRAPTLELTTMYGTVTLTNNTAIGPWPFPDPAAWRGMGTAAVPQMATCTEDKGHPCPVGSGDVAVYYEVRYTICSFTITAAWGLGHLINAGINDPECNAASLAIGRSICHAQQALGCRPYLFDCEDNDFYEFWLPMPDVSQTLGPICQFTQGNFFFTPTDGPPLNCPGPDQQCLSFDPVLYEVTFDADCSPCYYWTLVKNHLFAAGDTWTISEP